MSAAPGTPSGTPSGAPGARVSIRVRRWHIDVLVPGAATEGRYAVMEHRVAPGHVTTPRHALVGAVVTYYALAGTLTLLLADGAVRVPPGEAAVVPAGAYHAVVVPEGDGAGRGGDEAARFLSVVAPAGIEAYYADVAAAIGPTGAADMAAVHAAGARHGVAVDMASLYDIMERYGVHLV